MLPCFFVGVLRTGEFTTYSPFNPNFHQGVSDVQADTLQDPNCFQIHIKHSKTDPFRVGCYIYVGRGSYVVCLVVAMSNFLAVRGLSPGPLFFFADGRPLTRQLLSSTVQSLLRSTGYSRNYSGHSLRIGASTTSASWGLPDHLIKTLGRWSSDAYQCYIRTSAGSLSEVSSLLA